MILVTSVSQPEFPEWQCPDILYDRWRLDKTGRKNLTRQTIRALQQWMEVSQTGTPVSDNHPLPVRVTPVLGRITTLRVRYVSLLMSALSGDWKSMKVLRQGLQDKGLVQRMYDLDPYGLDFRSDLRQILHAIGSLPDTGM